MLFCKIIARNVIILSFAKFHSQIFYDENFVFMPGICERERSGYGIMDASVGATEISRIRLRKEAEAL